MLARKEEKDKDDKDKHVRRRRKMTKSDIKNDKKNNK